MATYYISPTGNDTTGNGSLATPWQTISKAVTGSTGGDTIICLNGTYTMANQTFSTGRTIQAQTNGQVIFDGGGGNIAWTINTTQTMTITGLRFTNISLASANSVIRLGVNGFVVNFISCRFDTIATYLNFFGGVIGNSNSQYGTLSMTTCLVYGLTGNGGTAPIFCNLPGSGSPTQTYSFINCVFYNSIATTWVNVSGSVSAGVTKNSVFALGVASASGPQNTCTYSCFYNVTGFTAGTGNITSDPLFVDVANADFRLRPASPCIDTGVLI